MQMTRNTPKSAFECRRRTRLGFTLMELIVVLVVLVALAGILVPILPNMITRAHSATGAASAQETAKAIQMYESLNFRHPNGWDSLVEVGTGLTLRPDRFTVVELNGGTPLAVRIQDALISAGIVSSYTMAAGIQGNGRPEGHSNAPANGDRINTFSPYAGPIADPTGIEDLADGGRVVTLGGSALNELNRFGFPAPGAFEPTGVDPTTAAYVLFGVGQRLTAVGQTMSSAPVHFPEAGDLPPTLKYSRLGAIYRIPANGPAELATVAAIHNDHLDSIDEHLAEFYETVE
jgi:prepilin-type N-terminal cleavage/methylation domain-containing protein